MLEETFHTGASPAAVVKEKGLSQVSDTGELEAVIWRVLEAPANQKAIADFKAGKESALNFLFGAVMKETRGKANPGVVRELLRQKLTA